MITPLTGLATSSLPLLRDFGTIVGINIAVTLASAVVTLPPTLAWADQRNWVSKGFSPDEMLNAWGEQRGAPPPAPKAGESAVTGGD